MCVRMRACVNTHTHTHITHVHSLARVRSDTLSLGRARSLSLLTLARSLSPSVPLSPSLSNGKALCENMWNGAFKYEADDSKACKFFF